MLIQEQTDQWVIYIYKIYNIYIWKYSIKFMIQLQYQMDEKSVHLHYIILIVKWTLWERSQIRFLPYKPQPIR